MIYLLDVLNFELFERSSKYRMFSMWETTEERVKGWIQNERSRSFIDKKELVNLFDIKQKVQITEAKRIKLKINDKIIMWTHSGRYFVLEFSEYRS